jgi:hypothetical protein
MMSASASIMPRPGCRGDQREDVRGGVGFNFGISLFGTISFTARTAGANSLGGFTFFG